MTHTVAKLNPWSSVKGHVEVLLKTLDPEDVTVMLPYGLQLIHCFRHPHVLRCMATYHSTKGNTFVTHIDSGAALIMYTWTMSSLNELKVDCQKFQIHAAINNLLSVPQHRVFIGYCSDMTLRVFSDILHKCSELSRMKAPTSVLCMAYNEDMDELVTGGHGSLETWKMAHVELREPLTPGRPINCDITSEDWVRDIRVFQKQRQLVALCNEGIYMVDYVNNQQLFHMPNWHATALTSFVWYRPLEYFITASMDGTIKVWNAIVFSQVHEFIGHYNCVTGLVTHPTDPLLISSSKDGTLRIWRLDTFQLTQRIDVTEEILGMRIAHGNQLYYYTLHDVKVWNFNQFHHLFTPIQSCIHKLARIKSTRMSSRILCAAEDGSVRLISTVSGSVLTIIYPMATYQVHTDIIYDPMSHRIYTTLNSGDILVFDTSTNPCQARELWVPPVPDESILCLALVKLDCALGLEESATCESLIFGGHNSGQISLLEATTSHMKDTVQGHGGAIMALECSHGTLCGGRGSGSADRLMSCGSDKRVNVWRLCLMTESGNELCLQCLCSIPCPVCPSHISMMFSSVCLALPTNNSIVVCELLDSYSRTGLGKTKPDQSNEIRRHKHLKDHDHTKPINGLCSCPSLGLFASASSDGSVKIWDKTNTLVRELCFDPSLSGVCFANDHGDILVGFQNHVSYVNVTSYLPYHFLEKAVFLHFRDEIKEEPLPFNPDHQLWFDIKNLPVFPTQLTSRRQYTRRLSQFLQQDPEDLIKSLSQLSIPSVSSTDRTLSATLEAELSQKHHPSLRIVKTKEMRDARKGSLGYSGNKDDNLNRFVGGAELDSPESEQLESPVHSDNSSQSDLTANSSPSDLKNVWPIAPDGYIPNSVLRGLMGYHRSPTPPRAPWVLKMIRGDMTDRDQKPDQEHLYESHEPFIWASSSEESFKLDSPEDSLMGSPFMLAPIPPHQTTSGTQGRQSLEDPSLKLNNLNLPMLVIPKFEPTEALGKSTKSKKKTRKTRGINLTGGGTHRKSKKQSLKLGELEEEDDSQSSYDDDSDADDLALLKRLAQEPWFPADVSLDVDSFISALILLLETTRDAQYRTVCNAVIDIYKEYNFSESLKNETLAFFEPRLESPRGVVRANAVRVMTQLGANRKEVILKLIPKLLDDEEAVKQEAITAVDKLAGIKTKEDLADYLNKIGLIKVYQNEDASVLKDLLHRCASVPQPVLPHLQSSLQSYVTTHQQCQARIRTRNAKRLEGDAQISEWNHRSHRGGDSLQKSRRNSTQIKKKQKKRVDRPIRQKQTAEDQQLEEGEEDAVDEGEESPGEDEATYGSESDLDYQSDEGSSTRVRFIDVSRRQSEDVPPDGMMIQSRRHTIHSNMLEAKAEMLALEKEAMVLRMKQNLRQHRERFEKLMSNMSERILQRKKILPVNPFFWKYYGIGPKHSRSFESSLAAQAGDSDFVESDRFSKSTEEVDISLASEVLKEFGSISKPSAVDVAADKTNTSSGRLDGELVESGFVESMLASSVKVTDPDGRTLETWGSSGVYTDSILEGIQVKSLRSRVTQSWSDQKMRAAETESYSLTVANVRKHEHMSAKDQQKEYLRKREAAANRLAKAEADVELWRNFLKDRGKVKKRRQSVDLFSSSGTKASPVTLPCIPAGTLLTSQGGNQRLLYSVSTGTSRSADVSNSAYYPGHFGSSEFGKLNMIWTTLSPIVEMKKRTPLSRPTVSLSDFPPVTTTTQRREGTTTVGRKREWLAAQLLYPSLGKLNRVKRFDRRMDPSTCREKSGVVYKWEKPIPVVLPSINSSCEEQDNFLKWRQASLVGFKNRNSSDENRHQAFMKADDPPCTPIVPRNSTISSMKLPQPALKLKTSC